MVLDIDETSLSNYQELLGADFAYNSTVFDAWVDSAHRLRPFPAPCVFTRKPSAWA